MKHLTTNIQRIKELKRYLSTLEKDTRAGLYLIKNSSLIDDITKENITKALEYDYLLENTGEVVINDINAMIENEKKTIIEEVASNKDEIQTALSFVKELPVLNEVVVKERSEFVEKTLKPHLEESKDNLCNAIEDTFHILKNLSTLNGDLKTLYFINDGDSEFINTVLVSVEKLYTGKLKNDSTFIRANKECDVNKYADKLFGFDFTEEMKTEVVKLLEMLVEYFETLNLLEISVNDTVFIIHILVLENVFKTLTPLVQYRELIKETCSDAETMRQLYKQTI